MISGVVAVSSPVCAKVAEDSLQLTLLSGGISSLPAQPITPPAFSAFSGCFPGKLHHDDRDMLWAIAEAPLKH